MARPIDADALYEVVSDHVTTVSVCPTVDWARGKSQMKEICLEDIANAPTVGGWISVKDRLPEPRHAVLAFTPYSNYILALSLHEDGTWYYWMDMGRKYYNPHLSGPITYWMYLPEPPKEDDNGE